MPREAFREELNHLVDSVLELGGEVEKSLAFMVEAMETYDSAVAERVVGVDALYKARGPISTRSA